jgi:predicted transcriptional regulator
MKKGYVPQKVELYYVIPAIRKEFAKIMISKGLSQKQVAGKLNITEAAVSQYMKSKRATEKVDFSSIEKEMEKSVDRILGGGSVIGETQRICGMAKDRGIVCKVSKKMGYAPKECRACFPK